MNKKLFLFTSTSCPRCPAAKEFLDNKGLEYEEMQPTKNPEAMELATKHGIMSLPTILIGEKSFSFEEFKSSF